MAAMTSFVELDSETETAVIAMAKTKSWAEIREVTFSERRELTLMEFGIVFRMVAVSRLC